METKVFILIVQSETAIEDEKIAEALLLLVRLKLISKFELTPQGDSIQT